MKPDAKTYLFKNNNSLLSQFVFLKKKMKTDHRYLFLRKKIVKNRKIFKTMAHSRSLKMIRHTLNILQHLLKHFLFVWPFLGPYALKSKVSDLPGY